MAELLTTIALASTVTSGIWMLMLTHEASKAYKRGYENGRHDGKHAEMVRVERLNQGRASRG
jgi:hypothetical protein